MNFARPTRTVGRDGKPLTTEEKTAALNELMPAGEGTLADNKFGEQTIDLSKPIIVPYSYQEFPKMVYDHKASQPSRIVQKVNKEGVEYDEHIPPKIVSQVVKDEAELRAALESGWKKEPPVQHPDAPSAEPEFKVKRAGEKVK